MRIKGRTAIVTGASSGIGRAAALRFAREGARVAVLDRDREELGGVARAIEAAGSEALSLGADVTDPAEVEQAVRQLDERWGQLDVVFANAGINGVWAPID